ncbi:hypothetical protein [Photobacterium damselae]|uniref:hypothetical protein n=1 Tax=Photobacterium damselae TaxID=38293 RepID=UPI004067F5FC
MGYRLRLRSIAKDACGRYRGLGADAIKSMYGYDDYSLCEPIESISVTYVGDAWDFGFEHHDATEFYDFDLHALSECRCMILSAGGLMKIIETFKREVSAYYAELKREIGRVSDSDNGKVILDRRAFGRLASAVSFKSMDWNDCGDVINTTVGDYDLSGSGSMEYMIFNFIHILKTFDFENNHLLLVGS